MTPSSWDRLDERSKAHERDIDEVRADIARMNAKLDEIIRTLSEAKGGWKTLMWIGGAGGAIGAMLTKAIPWTWAGN